MAGNAQRINPELQMSAQWWTLFQCAELNTLVAEALKNSPTVDESTARLKQAQEELTARAGATTRPSVSASASIEGIQPNLAAYGIPFPNPSPFALLNGSVAVSYALDVFGGNRRLLEELRAEREYRQWEWEGTRLALAGNVVIAVLRQAELQEQIDTTRHMIDLQQQETAITESRYHSGGAPESDLRSQQTTLAQMRATVPPMLQQLDVTRDLLAVLVGKSPGLARVPNISLAQLTLPAELPLSLPSTLVRQRPDVRGAEALLHKASADVGVATANQYPQFVLSGSVGALGTSFASGGDLWNIGTSLTQPIFNGGSLRAKTREAQQVYQEVSASYRQTVIEAFRQVADTLYAIQHDAETLQARTEAANQAEATYRIASARYQAGGMSQLGLLDAERQHLQTSLDRIGAAASRFVDSATLMQALGGGWWNDATSGQTPSH
jgi:NodT family efflux transporter outer membrane factor (OMF) lipoprotein